jgi:multidrug efflux pump subunit AcrA (membrane-fusion protein)
MHSGGEPERVGQAPGARPADVDAGHHVDPAGRGLDLVYQMPNPGGVLRPGQRVSVTLALQGREEALVAPWSAILFDYQGGTWVYENRAPHVFRSPPRGAAVRGGVASRARPGPAPGTRVVTDGAAAASW